MGRHSRVQFGQKFRVFWVKLVLSCWVPATAGPRVCSALVMAEVKFGGSLGCADPEKDPAVCWMSWIAFPYFRLREFSPLEPSRRIWVCLFFQKQDPSNPFPAVHLEMGPRMRTLASSGGSTRAPWLRAVARGEGRWHWWTASRCSGRSGPRLVPHPPNPVWWDKNYTATVKVQWFPGQKAFPQINTVLSGIRMREGVIRNCHGFLCCGLSQTTAEKAVGYDFQFLITSHRDVALSLRLIIRKHLVAAVKITITLQPALKSRKSVIIKMSFQHACWLLWCLYAAFAIRKKNILCIGIAFPAWFHPLLQASACPWSPRVAMGPLTPVKASRSSAVGSTGPWPEPVPGPGAMELRLVKGLTCFSVEATCWWTGCPVLDGCSETRVLFQHATLAEQLSSKHSNTALPHCPW